MRSKLPFTKEDALKWASQYSTPFYVYDEEGIRECVNDLYKAFSWNEGFQEKFAVKAAPTPGLLRLLKSLGCGADCASESEVLMALASDISGHNIIFSSNETLPEEYRAAHAAGALLNLDDITQIEHMEESVGIPDTVFLRYNPGEYDSTNEIMGHLYDSKFGMTKEQLFEGYEKLKIKGVRHFGLHAMLASCTLDNDYYADLARILFKLIVEIRDKLGITIEYVDMAGGIGIPYLPEEKAIDIAYMGESVRRVYEEILVPVGLKVRICTEMGRYITGPYGYLVTKVVGFKHIYKEYVGVDATACDLMRPAMYGAYHHIRVLGKEDAPLKIKVDVVGSLCENNDKFAIDRELPEVEMGDFIVIEDAGAHGYAMGYNYNGKLKCPELLMHADKSVTLIRRGQTIEDYFSTLDVDKDFTEALKSHGVRI